MTRIVSRMAALFVALVAAVGAAAAPAWAAGPDLAALSRGARGAIGATVDVSVGIANHGDPLTIQQVVLNYRAPAGTVIVKAAGTACVFNQERTTARCGLGTEWRSRIAARPEGGFQTIQVKITSRVTGTGSFTVTCGCDAKKANNSAEIVIEGAAKPQPTASPKPSAKPRPSESPSPQQSLSPQETFEPDYGSEAPVVAAPPAAEKDSSSSGFLLIGVGAVLFGLVGLGGAAYLWRDRSGGEEDDTE
ncbi:hypothetical protein GCM10009679_37860 [Saccharothrix algeriensis]